MHAIGTVSDKDLRIISKQHFMEAKAIESNLFEFPKDIARQVNLPRSYVISILAFNNSF